MDLAQVERHGVLLVIAPYLAVLRGLAAQYSFSPIGRRNFQELVVPPHLGGVNVDASKPTYNVGRWDRTHFLTPFAERD